MSENSKRKRMQPTVISAVLSLPLLLTLVHEGVSLLFKHY